MKRAAAANHHHCHHRNGIRQRGLALPAVVFLIVAVGLMLSSGLLLLAGAQHSQVQLLTASRAEAAARSANEWGAYQVSDPAGALALPADTLPPCFASRTLSLPNPLDDLQVSVSCTREPASGSVDEGGLRLASYRVVADVRSGNSGSSDFVRRQLESRLTVCRNPGNSTPPHSC